MRSWIRRAHGPGRYRGEAGASSAEYALLIAAIAAVIVLVVFALGTAVRTQLTDTCQALASQQSGTC